MTDTPSNSRREFLRNALGLVVVSSVAPTVALGRILPVLSQDECDNTIATYVIDLNEPAYAILQAPGGSVRLTSNAQLKLNPDHCRHQDLALRFGAEGDRRGWYPIIIVRTKQEDVQDAFCAVSSFCKHAKFYQVRYHGELGEVGYFECTHEKSRYTACGIWQPGEGPDLKDLPNPNLTSFGTSYDPVNKRLTLTRVLGDDVAGSVEPPTTEFIDPVFPTPAVSYALIRYGLPNAATISLSLYSAEGKLIDTIQHGRREQGVHHVDLPVDALPSGTYYIHLTIDDRRLTRRLVVVR